MADIVLDLETQESFQDVGGRSNLERLTVSVLGLYRYDTDELFALEEDELEKFGQMLQEEDTRIIGYNIHGFDLPILKKYVGGSVTQVATVDLMDDVAEAIGRRLPLDALLEGTLSEGKTGHGLKAIELWRAGKVEEVKQYCLDDVRLTRDLFEYGREHGEVFYASQVDSSQYRVPVRWGGQSFVDVDPILEQARAGRLCVAVSFTPRNETNEREGTLEPRRVDDRSVEGVLRETGETIRIDKSTITRAQLVMQRFEQ